MIVWTDEAIESIAQTVEYISQRSPDQAAAWATRIFECGEDLAFMPRSRRLVPELGAPDIREALQGDYRIWFRIMGDDIHILVVFHGARHVPD